MKKSSLLWEKVGQMPLSTQFFLGLVGLGFESFVGPIIIRTFGICFLTQQNLVNPKYAIDGGPHRPDVG